MNSNGQLINNVFNDKNINKVKNAEENPECMNAVIIKNRHGNRGTCALKWNGR